MTDYAFRRHQTSRAMLGWLLVLLSASLCFSLVWGHRREPEHRQPPAGGPSGEGAGRG
jgi:hypothetical protein